MYIRSCALIRFFIKTGWFADFFYWLGLIWIRHNKIVHRLKAADFDYVIDAGANIGEFAHLARLALPKATILCIEPHPDCAATLRKDGFQVEEAALWKESGEIMLRKPTEANTSCTVIPQEEGFLAEWKVKTISLKDIVPAARRVLVKMDLQGADWIVLQSIPDTLWSRLDGLIIEVSVGANGNFEKIRKLLESKNFHETSTLHELEQDGQVIEADKLWIRAKNTPLP